MLSTHSSLGLSLAEVLPTCLASVNRAGRGDGYGRARIAVVIVVDGLGYTNLKQRKGYARFLWGSNPRRIETVAPSTTGAALTTITTGTLPGVHGLIGYRIRDPRRNQLVTTLSEWEDIGETRDWQRSETVFEQARSAGVPSAVIGRKAHAQSGLTRAILTGADYVSAESITDRFAAASELVRLGQHPLVYLYVDELDRVAHASGWSSTAWQERLELLDISVRGFIAALPVDVGAVMVADHGIVDVPERRHILYDEDPEMMRGVSQVGGEPRFRYLYLENPANAQCVVDRWREVFGRWATILTRDEALEKGIFGPVDDCVVARLGDVIIAATAECAFYSSGLADKASRRMTGQHGSLTPEELGVPLIRWGAFA
ncbi:alkaline phosphatase family protein [Klugiella xanthotipulae]